MGGYFGGCIQILGGVPENPRFRPPRVDCHGCAKVFSLEHLSPLLTVRKEFAIFVLYSLVNILKINRWYLSNWLQGKSFRDFEIFLITRKGDVDFN